MHTVLIVDDEEPVIESYSFILDQGVEGFTLAGIARNGNEAVSRIHDLRPDVVFLDINMPGLDGLEVMERVHADFPGTVFVLSTAYERFDIAKRAIPLGVFAYLVKPVTKKVFVETLDAIREELSRRKTLRDPGTAALLVNRFLREDAWKEIDEGGWSRIRETLSVETDFGIVAFVELDSEQDNLFPRINTSLDLKHRFLFTTHLGKGMYFFPGAQERSLISSSIERCVATSVPKDVLSIIGVGSSRSYRELHRSCAEALAELGNRKDVTETRMRERLRVTQLRRKMGLGEQEEVRAMFEDYWQEVFSSYPFEIAKGKLVSFFSLVLDDAADAPDFSESAPLPFDPAEEIVPLRDLAEWGDWSRSAVSSVFSLARIKRTGRFPLPLVKALSFIEECWNKPIQLSDVAERSLVSTAYLSKLFSDHLDSTFVDYLTELRVTHAERLIRETRLTVKEVAHNVGYQDPNYFSKVFRKTVGISPSMYAERSRYENESH